MKDCDVFITNNLLVEHFEEKQPDIFMYNRTLPPQHTEKIADLKKKYGFKTCVDVDDYWELDDHHILYDHYQEIQYAKMQIEHLRNADVVLTTHHRLAGKVAEINPNVHVCQNAIPHQGQYDIERIPYHLTRLFWQGSDTHRADISILTRPIDQLKTIAGKIKMVISGYAEDNEPWEQMIWDYTAQCKHQYKIIPYLPVSDYYKPYAEADICLVPLVKSPFNAMKSNLKILEAANLGLPVIASSVDPYLSMPIMYCKTGGDWVRWITRLAQSKKRQKEAGEELAEYCREHFNFHKINNTRKQILEYVASKSSVS